MPGGPLPQLCPHLLVFIPGAWRGGLLFWGMPTLEYLRVTGHFFLNIFTGV